MTEKKLVIVGDSALAEIAFEYFTHDSPYEVVAFAVERAYLKRDTLFDLPVVALEDLPARFAPADHDVFVAVAYGQLNRLRARLLRAAKEMGYRPASYVSSRAFVWRNVSLGEHCFVMENNVVQPFVRIGDNVVLWSGNHIGHHSVIGDNVFISSHVVVSGFSTVGANSFLGVNSTMANNLTLGRDCWVGPNVTLMGDTPDGTLYPAASGEPSKVSAPRFFKVKDPS